MRFLFATLLLLVPTALLGQIQPAVEDLSLAELRKVAAQRNRTGHQRWTYARYSSGRGIGSAVVSPTPAVKIGKSIKRVTLSFTAGSGGIAAGGHVTVWLPNGSGVPRLGSEGKGNNVTASASGHPVILTTEKVWLQELVRQPRLVKATFPDGLPEGAGCEIKINRFWPGRGTRGWKGDYLIFRVYVDHDADGWSEEIENSPKIRRKSDPAANLYVTAQSTAVAGRPVRLTVRALDEHGNPAGGYRGTIRFAGGGKGAQLPDPYTFAEDDYGSRSFEATLSETGFHWITIEDAASSTLTNHSNPIEVHKLEPEYSLLWGDLHVHTSHSADAANTASWATTPSESYAIGRWRYGLDFQANADHHGLNNFSPRDWEAMKRATNEANHPGVFTTLVGVEMSGPRGDQNIYYLTDDPPDIPVEGNDPPAIWAHLKGQDLESFAVPHHVAQSMRPYRWEMYNPEYNVVAEIHSEHGRAEFLGNEPHYSRHAVPTLEGKTWQEQLAKGHRIGCIASSDDHTARPGGNGLTGVWAKANTREEIYWNIKKRHAIATTNTRSILHFTVNGSTMGTEIESAEPPRIRVKAAARNDIVAAVIVKNNENVHRVEGDGRSIDFEWTDAAFDGDAFYYLRLEVRGDPRMEAPIGDLPQFSWANPVWVRSARQQARAQDAGYEVDESTSSVYRRMGPDPSRRIDDQSAP